MLIQVLKSKILRAKATDVRVDYEGSLAIDEDLMDKNGRLDLDRAGLIAYNHGEYFELGKKIGKFGFSVKKK